MHLFEVLRFVVSNSSYVDEFFICIIKYKDRKFTDRQLQLVFLKFN